ncbi:MAG: hypothetical protein GY679_05065 [Mycoplasma sp.]|nr:hypothetical protein [Mycoplasma sp.]
MDLKPINQQDTITFINTSTFHKPLTKTQKVVKDPQNTIPNGIYGVINWEIRKQKAVGILSTLFLITAIVLIILQLKLWKTGPLTYIPTVSLLLISIYKSSICLIEFLGIKKSVVRYRQDMIVGLTSTPPFISKMYIDFNKKQVSHNWITFSFIFYGGLFSLLLWWLKDVKWWIFDFKKWIQNLFGQPKLVATLVAVSLLIVVIIHIAFAIMRKKRISDMNMYFGQEMATQSQIEEIKTNKNKLYRRIFLISVLIILIIPIIIRIILKIINRKR